MAHGSLSFGRVVIYMNLRFMAVLTCHILFPVDERQMGRELEDVQARRETVQANDCPQRGRPMHS